MAYTSPKTWTAALVAVSDMQAVSNNQAAGPFSGDGATNGTPTALTTLVGANLGDGCPGTLRVGAGQVAAAQPLDLWDLVYDGVLGKWRTKPQTLLSNISGALNATSYQSLCTAVIPHPGTAWTLFLRARGFVSSATAGETTTAAVSSGFYGNAGVTLPGEIGGVFGGPGTEAGAAVSSANTQKGVDTGWIAPTPNGSAAPWIMAVIRIKSSAAVGAKAQSNFQLDYYWRQT
jgi:hypothetical protein